MARLIIRGNEVYEIDEECMRRKEGRRKQDSRSEKEAWDAQAEEKTKYADRSGRLRREWER